MTLHIRGEIVIPLHEVQLEAVRSQGAGGQNVNKSATAIHLRFHIARSSLPASYKKLLLDVRDHRISSEGVVVIKAQQHRSQEKNRSEALERLQALVRAATTQRAPRKATRPSRSSRRRRLDSKKRRSEVKSGRKPVDY